MTDSFYRAFEERFRGTREAILERQKVYLPFIRGLLQQDAQASVMDLGCGRGEWLELLVSEGVQASGCDLDAGMLEACTERGLAVERADALNYLKAQPDQSCNLVSAFHLVEHLPFDHLRELINQIHRVLKPGGLLLFETPNPENLSVGSCSFYLDPTHLHPLPPELLGFMTEYAGFTRFTTLRLQEEPRLHADTTPALFSVLSGVSPDYAIIAQKNAPVSVLQSFDELFLLQTGLSLPELAARHDLWWQRELHRVEHDAHELARGALQRHDWHEQRLAELEQKFQQQEQKLLQQEEALRQIYSSASWRLLGPLRWLGRQWRQLRADGLSARLRAVMRRCAVALLPRLGHRLEQRPALKRWLLVLLRKLGLFERFRRLYRVGSDQPGHPGSMNLTDAGFLKGQRAMPTPGARDFHARLKRTLDQREER